MAGTTEQALRELLALSDDSGGLERVEIRGCDPVLPTRYPIGEAAAAALAASALAAARLWTLCGGRDQRIGVDVRAAAASLISFLHLRVDDRPLREAAARLTSPVTALYPARDGRWIHLHGGFPHLAEGVLQVLGCRMERDDIARAVAARDALEIEEALAAAHLCGAAVRTREEWAAHPQGQSLARLPIVEIRRIADADPAAWTGGPAPLSGVRVLDLTRVLAGPTCGRSLAGYGADVLRVGSSSRPSIPHFVLDTGHGKRSAQVDLDRADGRSILTALIRDCDVFVQGYRPGALARRGFGIDDVAALRPGIVGVSISCYGEEGPWSERAGWEQLAQSSTGIAAHHGTPGAPRLLPAAACDYTTGYLAAFGTLIALARRMREGGSWWVRVSLCRTATWLDRLGTAHDLDPAAARPPDGAELARWSLETRGPFGRVRHLAPAVEMSETPARWSRPAVPLGHDAPVWLPRT